MDIPISNVYSEVFDGFYLRVLVTSNDIFSLREAATSSTSNPSIVIGRIEGGIESFVSKKNTPDGRVGVILQFWISCDEKKPRNLTIEKFYKEFSYRVRQDILVKPFMTLFDASISPIEKLDMMHRIGHCGDGYEWVESRYGREMIIIPIMVPDFQIEHYLWYGKGFTGANFWYMCKTKKAVMEAGRKALQAINKIKGVITPFGICSAGSKADTKFPWIGGTTNHNYCPSLREQLGTSSRVPDKVNYIPEIVINGITLDSTKKAMKAGIKAVSEVKGVIRISAGNYEGLLGKHKIFLKELFP